MRLSLDQIIEFQTRGFIIVEDVLSDADLQPVIDELNVSIDERARALYQQGKITELHEDEPFERRFTYLHQQCPEISRGFDIMQLRGKAMFELLGNEKLLDVVECVLGSELECNPIQHVRAKVPARVVDGKLNTYGNVPWHQDAAVTSEDADPSEIITFWMPLVDATAETGCMELIPEAFKRGYLKHQGEGGTMIVPELMPDEKPVTGEIRKGGVIIMNKYTPHRGTNNVSDKIRWSLDLRYHKTGAASGRSHHPSFVVRSRSNPNSVLRDHAEWSRLWEKALASKEKVKLHRV